MQNLSDAVLRQRITARIKKIADSEICISGSMVKTERKCGRKNCKCATNGQKHPAHVLTSKVKGKTKTVYLPVDMVDEVRQWVKQRKRIRTLLDEIDALAEQIIRRHVKASRATKKNVQRSRDVARQNGPQSQ
jgi:hypothetical protein